MMKAKKYHKENHLLITAGMLSRVIVCTKRMFFLIQL
jgi:hypothetical protein